jgi:hypothetical protein
MQLNPEHIASLLEANRSVANQETSLVARPGVPTAIFVKIRAFCDVTSCRLVTSYRRFGKNIFFRSFVVLEPTSLIFITVLEKSAPDSQIQTDELSLLHSPCSSLRSILILCNTLRLCPLRNLSPSHFPTETLYI